ncbi:condensin subunit Smc [Microbacteriaceae bacterium MWH-Ta3]|nr:condensin subunit Smc [Microbacteriaceae bacterium MWH-Ta3]
MHLKSLTLKGFKSFAQPTTFQFEPGVTAVVGPNGSGKSNVVDALAWVMGEQGAKTLRGGKMEDVIFAGTSTRGPLGRAEVILTIDNADGALPIEYTEVTISRTLFRNGQSDYAINGESCRLLDVQELLSDSGLGREMHVIVGQGRLDNVLQATPEDRRGFIEEAAGILKHRRRKEKTVRKLEAMQTNLTRLNDLAGEIRRQLKPLGKQAEVAREAQNIAAVVRDARSRILADDVVTLRREVDDHQRSENERQTERIVVGEQLEQVTLRLAHLEERLTSDAVDGARRTAHDLEQVRERLRSLSNLAHERIVLLSSDIAESVPLISVTDDMVDQARADVVAMHAQIAEVEERLGHAAAHTATASASLDAIDHEIAEQGALISQHDLDKAALESRVDIARSRVASAKGEQLRYDNARDAAVARRDDAETQLDGLDTLDGGDNAELEEAVTTAETQALAAQSALDAAREALHTQERERDGLAARVSALSLALDSRDGSSSLAGRSGIRGIVADAVQVDAGFETAIAAALGGLAEAVLADSRDAAVSALNHVDSTDAGRVDILFAETDGAVESAIAIAGLDAALDRVKAPAGVRGVLARAYIAADLDAARAAWPAIVDAGLADTAVLVTRSGEVLTRFLLRGGQGAQPSRIELAAERDEAQSKLEKISTQIERDRNAVEALRDEVTTAKQRSQKALTDLRAFDARHAEQVEAVSRLRAGRDAAIAELERLDASLDKARATVAEAQAETDAAIRALDEFLARPRPVLDATSRDRAVAELDAARQSEMTVRIEMETLRERHRAERDRAEELARSRDAERAAVTERAALRVKRRAQLDRAEHIASYLPPVLAAVDESVAEAHVRLAEEEATRNENSAALTDLRRQESELRERYSRITDGVHGLEMQIYEKKLHLSSLLERAADEFGLVEEVLIAEFGPETLVPQVDGDPIPFDRAEQAARLKSAERSMEQLGRVNPLALEEFAALEQRHTFLTEQLADLEKTRADLLQIIEELDEKMQVIFLQAFHDTKAAFEDILPVLFPGGTGHLLLTDPDSPLTTGIEVSVKPVGKKIERLSLLSGGERSLAAVALLVAIFKARPSPFYILDEVEAALDDANLGRLLTIIEGLRESSQLIIITHQKRTMEIADALYGVSMRQDGVSAVVGQRVKAGEA